MTASPNRASTGHTSTNALVCAGLVNGQGALRLDFHSIGRASPGNAAAIAVGLGVPVTTAMEALYRAPAVLVDGLSEEHGRQMCALLEDLGCDVTLEPQDARTPDAGALLDVALYITDTSRFGDITRALAAFLGINPGEAARLACTPPGIVLGKVSQATVNALAERLGAGADLQASNPDTALYDVFLGPCDAAVRARLLADLRRRGLPLIAESGCLLTGLAREDVDQLWATHQRLEALRVVNRAFLRFDLVLTGGSATPRATRALIDVAGVPEHIVPRLFAEGEITVMEALPHAHMLTAMERLADSGLELRADLISFQHLGLEITALAQPGPVREILHGLGVAVDEYTLRRLPCRLPCTLPELQARMLRDALVASGARLRFIDPTETEEGA